MSTPEPEPEAEHGIDGAVYARHAHGLVPVLFCLCGFETGPGNDSWEEAGAELDEHMEQTESSP